MSLKSLLDSSKITLHIYTDGSDMKFTSGRLKYAGWFKHNGKEYRLSKTIDELKIKEYYKTKYNQKVDISNPTLEVAALYNILKLFQETNMNIIIFSDYTGVKNWFDGSWKINKIYIKDLIKSSWEYAKKIESKGGSVQIQWIKAHDGVQGNEMADFLAGQEEDVDTFSKFLTEYSVQ